MLIDTFPVPVPSWRGSGAERVVSSAILAVQPQRTVCTHLDTEQVRFGSPVPDVYQYGLFVPIILNTVGI